MFCVKRIPTAHSYPCSLRLLAKHGVHGVPSVCQNTSKPHPRRPGLAQASANQGTGSSPVSGRHHCTDGRHRDLVVDDANALVARGHREIPLRVGIRFRAREARSGSETIELRDAVGTLGAGTFPHSLRSAAESALTLTLAPLLGDRTVTPDHHERSTSPIIPSRSHPDTFAVATGAAWLVRGSSARASKALEAETPWATARHAHGSPSSKSRIRPDILMTHIRRTGVYPPPRRTCSLDGGQLKQQ